MTKVECPTCGMEGFLEQRGSSLRIKHYAGFENGTRKYVLHKVAKAELAKLGINGNQSLGIKTEELNSFPRTKWTGGELNPRPLECKSSVHTRLNYQPTDLTCGCVFW